MKPVTSQPEQLVEDGQIDLLPAAETPSPEPLKKRPARKRNVPTRVIQRDFFVADFSDVSTKNDRHSMEHPIYAISKMPDMEIRYYEHNGIEITVVPSHKGRATILDKDLLIYITSQLVQGINSNRTDSNNRTVRIRAYDYFVSTGKGSGGKDYDALEDTLDRLKGTILKTNIETGGERRRRGFGLIEDWEIVERGKDKRMDSIEITLSRWLFNAIKSLEVLTINKDYFQLKGGLEKRLYELARKHCGNQATWLVGEEILFKKSGTTGGIGDFRRMLKKIIENDSLPDYRMRYDEKERQVAFYTKDMKQLNAAALAKLLPGKP
ncbi:replication initiator protein A [Escherichia coli]|uniref:replication initiator protein A n=1 Tax=Escherichia coli TaxID=562 RepID=UPI003F8B531F